MEPAIDLYKNEAKTEAVMDYIATAINPLHAAVEIMQHDNKLFSASVMLKGLIEAAEARFDHLGDQLAGAGVELEVREWGDREISAVRVRK